MAFGVGMRQKFCGILRSGLILSRVGFRNFGDLPFLGLISDCL